MLHFPPPPDGTVARWFAGSAGLLLAMLSIICVRTGIRDDDSKIAEPTPIRVAMMTFTLLNGAFAICLLIAAVHG